MKTHNKRSRLKTNTLIFFGSLLVILVSLLSALFSEITLVISGLLFIFLISRLPVKYLLWLLPFSFLTSNYSLIQVGSVRSLANSVDIDLSEIIIIIILFYLLLNVLQSNRLLVISSDFGWLLALGGWILITWMWSPYFSTAVVFSLRLWIGLIASFLLINLITDRKVFSGFLLSWGISGIFLGFLAFWDFFQYRFLELRLHGVSQISLIRPRVLNFQPLQLSLLLSLGLICLVAYLNLNWYLKAGYEKVILILGAVLILGALGLTFSRGIWISVAGGVLFYILLSLKTKDKIIQTMLILLLLAAVSVILIPDPIWKAVLIRIRSITNLESGGAGSRLALWKASFMIVDKHWIWGRGFGTYGELLRTGAYLDDPKVLLAHNIYLQLMVSIGLMGLFLFSGFLGTLIKRFWTALNDEDSINQRVSLTFLAGITINMLFAIFNNHLFRLEFWCFWGVCMVWLSIYKEHRDDLGKG